MSSSEEKDARAGASPEANQSQTDSVEWILVTGGSRGIGRAVVEALVAEGRRVAFTYRAGDQEAKEVEGASAGLATAHRLDLEDRDGTKALVSLLESEGSVVGLVNNAGVQSSALLAMTSDAEWDRMLDINLAGAFRCCRAVLPAMVRRRSGAIVNMSSLAALRGVAGQAAYAASKAGLLAMTRVLAREMGRRNIRVNAVVPGLVETDMTRGLNDAARQGLRSAECLPGGTTVDGVASAVVYLLSDRASSITGQCLHVDAGASC